ncbi:MAG: hypothetical protein JWM59_5162 [Verrucomicrobiales bacterium]|nr:hypothetical protein [Verrucomicrobiales bacterium]
MGGTVVVESDVHFSISASPTFRSLGYAGDGEPQAGRRANSEADLKTALPFGNADTATAESSENARVPAVI